MIPPPILEDELGDVLEKALKLAGWREDELAARSGVDVNRIKDVLDYRYELPSGDLGTLARALRLNEVGVQALAAGSYPTPELRDLPFRLDVLAMPYGVGVVNAYLVRRADGDDIALLIDSGHCPHALERAWPNDAQRLDAHLVTHWDPDHTGGCGETLARFDLPYCCGPGPAREGVRVLRDGETLTVGEFRVEALSTPGPAREHLCFLIGLANDPEARRVLFSGDLFFCGSIGGGFHDPAAVLFHARRLWRTLPGGTIVAPGHGSLTTIAHERTHNPFAE
jgi:glyoxylase-like metal-dependent hydrolase (beta-lactamase superfamily II)